MIKMILFYRDLEDAGFGSRATIWRKVRMGTFPAPMDYDGRPAWTTQMIDDHISSLPQAAIAPRRGVA